MSDVSIRVGNAPCSWGTIEIEGMAGETMGCARFLDELAATGYTGTELGDWGFLPTDPAQLHAELAARGLTLLGAFVPVNLKDPAAHASGETRVLQTASLLAAVLERSRSDTAPFLVLADDNGSDPVRTSQAGRIAPADGLSDTEWTIFARGANHLAEAVRTHTGLRTVFHHHCGGYVETPSEIATLLARTDPELLGLVFDTGHLAYGSGPDGGGGAAVIEALNRFADRIWYLHLKDCEPTVAARARAAGNDYVAAVRQGVFCELGRGCVDFRAVIEWFRHHGYRGWALVEQDVLPGLGSPKESAQRNRDFLRTLGL